MKSIITSYTTSTSEQFFTVDSLNHIQQAYKEVVDSIMRGIIPYTTNDVIILYGCVFTGTDPGARTLTAGAIYYNGEIYLVPSASFTTTGSNIPLWTIVETFISPNDPMTFSDGASHNVHSIKQFVLVQGLAGGSGITGYVCDYNSAVVKNLSDNLNSSAWKSASVVFSNSDGTSLGSKTIWYVKNGKTVTVTFDVSFVPAGASTSTIHISLPSGIIPNAPCYNSVVLEDNTLSTVSVNPKLYTIATNANLFLFNGNTGQYTNGSTYEAAGQITFSCS